MPDITMCQSEKCPRKNECYRYRAMPDILQHYCDFLLYHPQADRCFIPIGSKPVSKIKENENLDIWKEQEDLINSEEFKNASEIQKTEFLMALKLRRLLQT